MEKRKRKRDEITNRIRPLTAVIIALILIGLISVPTVLLVSRRMAAPPTYVPSPTTRPLPTPVYRPYPTPTYVAVYTPRPQPARVLSGGGHIVYSTWMGEIVNFDGDGMRSTGLTGLDAVESPDGDHLAYIRDQRLYLFAYRTGKEQPVDVRGTIRMPAWNADGSALAFVSRDPSTNVDTIYQLEIASMKLDPILVSRTWIAAPPISNPATNRLLIAEATSGGTEFYTIDPLCGAGDVCKESLRTVPYNVIWAAYQPNGTSIVFVEQTNGKLYALKTASKEIVLLVNDGVYKRRVAFGADASRLAYIDSNKNLYVLDLVNQSTVLLMPTNVASVNWAGN